MVKNKIDNLLSGIVIAKRAEYLLLAANYTTNKPRPKKHYSIFKYSTKK